MLVIDDDPDVLDSLAMVLGDAGYQVETAEGGEQALERLARVDRPSLILLDLMMPNMTGWEFCAAQRKDPRFAQIPVVLVSAADRLGRIAAELGVAGWVAKPFNLDRLLDEVAAHHLGEIAAHHGRGPRTT